MRVASANPRGGRGRGGHGDASAPTKRVPAPPPRAASGTGGFTAGRGAARADDDAAGSGAAAVLLRRRSAGAAGLWCVRGGAVARDAAAHAHADAHGVEPDTIVLNVGDAHAQQQQQQQQRQESGALLNDRRGSGTGATATAAHASPSPVDERVWGRAVARWAEMKARLGGEGAGGGTGHRGGTGAAWRRQQQHHARAAPATDDAQQQQPGDGEHPLRVGVRGIASRRAFGVPLDLYDTFRTVHNSTTATSTLFHSPTSKPADAKGEARSSFAAACEEVQAAATNASRTPSPDTEAPGDAAPAAEPLKSTTPHVQQQLRPPDARPHAHVGKDDAEIRNDGPPRAERSAGGTERVDKGDDVDGGRRCMKPSSDGVTAATALPGSAGTSAPSASGHREASVRSSASQRGRGPSPCADAGKRAKHSQKKLRSTRSRRGATDHGQTSQTGSAGKKIGGASKRGGAGNASPKQRQGQGGGRVKVPLDVKDGGAHAAAGVKKDNDTPATAAARHVQGEPKSQPDKRGSNSNSNTTPPRAGSAARADVAANEGSASSVPGPAAGTAATRDDMREDVPLPSGSDTDDLRRAAPAGTGDDATCTSDGDMFTRLGLKTGGAGHGGAAAAGTPTPAPAAKARRARGAVWVDSSDEEAPPQQQQQQARASTATKASRAAVAAGGSTLAAAAGRWAEAEDLVKSIARDCSELFGSDSDSDGDGDRGSSGQVKSNHTPAANSRPATRQGGAPAGAASATAAACTAGTAPTAAEQRAPPPPATPAVEGQGRTRERCNTQDPRPQSNSSGSGSTSTVPAPATTDSTARLGKRVRDGVGGTPGSGVGVETVGGAAAPPAPAAAKDLWEASEVVMQSHHGIAAARERNTALTLFMRRQYEDAAGKYQGVIHSLRAALGEGQRAVATATQQLQRTGVAAAKHPPAALTLPPGDRRCFAALLFNKALSLYHLGEHRAAVKDAIAATDLCAAPGGDPTVHAKATILAARCHALTGALRQSKALLVQASQAWKTFDAATTEALQLHQHLTAHAQHMKDGSYSDAMKALSAVPEAEFTLPVQVLMADVMVRMDTGAAATMINSLLDAQPSRPSKDGRERILYERRGPHYRELTLLKAKAVFYTGQDCISISAARQIVESVIEDTAAAIRVAQNTKEFASRDGATAGAAADAVAALERGLPAALGSASGADGGRFDAFLESLLYHNAQGYKQLHQKATGLLLQVNKYERLRSEATMSIAGKKYTRAYDLLREVLLIDTENRKLRATAFSMMGSVAMTTRRHSDAAEDYSSALKEDPGNAQRHKWLLALCRAYRELEDYDRAIAFCEEAQRAEVCDATMEILAVLRCKRDEQRARQRRESAARQGHAEERRRPSHRIPLDDDGAHTEAPYARRRSDAAPQAGCHYAVLNVRPGDPHEKIASAYRRLARQWHPDKWMASTEPEQATAARNFKRVMDAYTLLSDAKQRLKYDMGRGYA